MKKHILMAIVVTLLLLPMPIFAEQSVSPGSTSTGSGSVSSGSGPNWGAIFGKLDDIQGDVSKVPGKTANDTATRAGDALKAADMELLKQTDIQTYMFARSLRERPNLDAFAGVWDKVKWVIITLIGALFVYLVAIRFIISGANPEKREIAKENLRNLILMLFVVALSYWLYTSVVGLMYDISAYLSPANAIVASLEKISFGSVIIRTLLGGFYFILTWTAWIGLYLVKIMQMLGVVLFPIGVMLYLSGWFHTVDLGASILKFLVIITFVPLLNTIIFSQIYAMGSLWALAALLIITMINWHSVKKVFDLVVSPAVGAAMTAASAATGGVSKLGAMAAAQATKSTVQPVNPTPKNLEYFKHYQKEEV